MDHESGPAGRPANGAYLVKELGPMHADRRRNRSSRCIERVEKGASTPCAADGAEGHDPPRTSETSEKIPPLPEWWPPGRPNVTRGSQRDPDIRHTVSRHVKRLIQLYEMTDPVQGPASEDNKLEYARQAISIWWYLFGELLLWAQSQIAGYELGRSNPDFIHKLAKRFGREIDVDSHVLEYIGLCFSWNRVNYDDPTMEKVEEAMEKNKVKMDRRAIRYLIRELLVSRSANSSFWRFPLQSALFALNVGHVEDIVRPEPIRRQGNPVQLLNCKMMALQHVYYHIGRGLKKYRALELVGDELGQSPETLRAWEKAITRDEDFMMDLVGAKLAGELEDQIDNHSINELIEKYGAQYHRHTSDIEKAKYILDSIRSSPLKAIRDGLRYNRSRKAKKSGA